MTDDCCRLPHIAAYYPNRRQPQNSREYCRLLQSTPGYVNLPQSSAEHFKTSTIAADYRLLSHATATPDIRRQSHASGENCRLLHTTTDYLRMPQSTVDYCRPPTAADYQMLPLPPLQQRTAHYYRMPRVLQFTVDYNRQHQPSAV